MFNFLKATLRHLYRAKWGKALLVLFLAGVVMTAGASVSVFYYTSGTANVQSPDLRLVAGSDLQASCSVYPCAAGSVTPTHDAETVSFSFFPADTAAPIIPATYYSNFTDIQNTGTSNHDIVGIQVIQIQDPSSVLGSITVYVCSSQTQFTPLGAPASACVGSFDITSTAGGSVSGISSSTPLAINAGSTVYVEVAAYAAGGASGAVTFQIAAQWA